MSDVSIHDADPAPDDYECCQPDFSYELGRYVHLPDCQPKEAEDDQT